MGSLGRPSAEEFAEWRQHPVTEWVLALMQAHAGSIKDKWAGEAWESPTLDEWALREARVMADCYRAIPDTAYESWKALDDTEN